RHIPEIGMKPRRLDSVEQSDVREHLARARRKRFGEAWARGARAIGDDDRPAPRGEQPGHGRSGGAAAEDEDVYQSDLEIYARTYGESTYSVGWGIPASRKASWRSRHLLHTPQCRKERGAPPLFGFMHDNVCVKSTPSRTPRWTTTAFSTSAN